MQEKKIKLQIRASRGVRKRGRHGRVDSRINNKNKKKKEQIDKKTICEREKKKTWTVHTPPHKTTPQHPARTKKPKENVTTGGLAKR